MALTPRLDLRQQQALVMTPQLQQAIKLLQMSNLELAEFVEAEIEQNPMLERDDGEAPAEGAEAAAEAIVQGTEPAAPEAARDNTFDEGSEPDTVDLSDAREMPGNGDAGLDTDYENVWDRDGTSDGPMNGSLSSSWDPQIGDGGSLGEPDPERTVAEAISLRDHLLSQINVDLDDPIDRMIALHLLDMLDDAGYITGDLNAVAQLLACKVERVQETLTKLQSCDPPGIFARSLAECLSLQLRERNRFDPAMKALLANLDLLAKREFPQLMKLCGVDSDDLAEMIGEIKALNPKPATAFDTSAVQPVTPDVIMRPRNGGGWIIELNADTMPRVLVNNRYYAILSKQARREKDKEYIIERFNTASWLVKSLHQRAQTILKVATEIVEQQDAFFGFGVEHLKPLTLRDVATVLSVHESTVSRVTNNKFIATPRGVYELKYFFNAGVSRSEMGSQHSAEAIRFRIRLLIDGETVENVLSDDQIVDILRGGGVDIARRTVAKYREAMRIPSSVQRRREKSLHL
jgi:RNA polymerase sigma-54 factor